MEIAMLIYDRFTALDAVGPYEVLSRLPGAKVTFVAEDDRPVRTDTRQLALQPDATLERLTAPEIVLVPGGPGQAALMEPGPVHAWLRAADATSTWTGSVCTGSPHKARPEIVAAVRAHSRFEQESSPTVHS